jgi:hypothetical protein
MKFARANILRCEPFDQERLKQGLHANYHMQPPALRALLREAGASSG